MSKLDKKDLLILNQLQNNGRMKVTELAPKVGLSVTPCQIRIKKMEEEGVISGYTALVDHTKLGLSHIAFVQVTLSKTSTKALNDFNDAVRNISEIEQCHMIASSFDYLLKVRTSDINEYRLVLGEKISNLPHALQTSTFISMENVKDPAG